ncbi:DNase I-like protein [Dothidotthia symphoricarpi CBS 119687]|uniref:DNase I-like protein n=1 Tax=Dothidotthia symphoricarpi CBS 119687 TaxID=1392245 RepID=A0A6A6AUW8_9PLEO|nr:DNase I-like protein [Dothidotthia symphoricarpi CBS 119687]KAF2134988.1 DNase I-like protein [Dothidotthia symphoricarpi CBS 119687]
MLQLYLLTFNCARELVDPQSLAPSFFDALPKAAPLPDVVAISLQEIAPIAYSFLGGSYLKPYLDRLTTTVQLAADLHSHGSEQLQHVATRSLGMTGLMIFAKPKFVERIQWIQSAGAGVGLWNMGNKGAIAMRIGVACAGYDDTLDLSFAAAHLAPSENNVDARNKDWENLVRNLVFVSGDESSYSSSERGRMLPPSTESPKGQSGLFTAGNHVFFYGDLNYRTHDTGPDPETHKTFPQPSMPESSPKHFSRLLERDQLTREKEANRTLHGLEELPIYFPPTYKYAMPDDKTANGLQRSLAEAEEEWKWSKHRYPSWCDRILFLPSHPSAKLEPQVYTSLPVQPTSDHRPVALSLRVDDRPVPRDTTDVRSSPPYPLNPRWESRQAAGRQCEVIVGVLSYLALTKKGNAALLAVIAMIMGSLWLAASFRT